MFDTLLSTLAPQLGDLLGLALIAVFTWIGQMMRRTAGLQAEAIWRDALHSALNTGALRSEGPEEVRLGQTLAYARRSVPDAIRNLAPSDDVLTDLAKSKLRQLARGD